MPWDFFPSLSVLRAFTAELPPALNAHIVRYNVKKFSGGPLTQSTSYLFGWVACSCTDRCSTGEKISCQMILMIRSSFFERWQHPRSTFFLPRTSPLKLQVRKFSAEFSPQFWACCAQQQFVFFAGAVLQKASSIGQKQRRGSAAQ